jgi:hypothetical protein
LGFPLPERAFWPLCPRPEVLPKPELRPRPRRFCFVVHTYESAACSHSTFTESAHCMPRAYRWMQAEKVHARAGRTGSGHGGTKQAAGKGRATAHLRRRIHTTFAFTNTF